MTRLEPGQLWVMRLRSAAAAVIILVAAILVEVPLGRRFDLPRGFLALPLLVPILYLVLLAPGRQFRAWGYIPGPRELEVRRGRWTHIATTVPLDRVQHIDISQGPLERAFSVCRLVLHTAGTMHSQVVLPGLSRSTAERMRDEIRAHIRQEEG